MQAKDIPEGPVLAFIAANEPCTWFWSADHPEHFPNSVLHAMPAGTPQKVGLAKMRALIRRGVIEGCGCGCRGDFCMARQ